MAVDAFMSFWQYSGGKLADKALPSESQVDFGQTNATTDPLSNVFTAGNVFEIETYSFDIEQTLNLSSQSQGTGAGKIKFNGFSVTRKIDRQSPNFFQMACAGTPFALVSLGLRKAAGGTSSGLFFLRFDMKMVAVETINWSHDEESPKEEIKFQFGGLQVLYVIQNNDGTLSTANPGGWNQISNIADVPTGKGMPTIIANKTNS